MKQPNKIKTLSLKNTGINIPNGGGEFLGKIVLLINGLVDGYNIKTTNFGDSVALQGEFNAINPINGEAYLSNVAYLPSDFAAMIQKKLDNRKDSSETVEFSAQITPVKSEKGARGYTFVMEPVQTVEVYNRRTAMLEKLQSQFAALPAPVEQPKIEEKKETAKSKAA